MTKPTNEERREVARKLRKNAEEHPKMQLILNVAFACDSLRPEGAMDWNVTAHDAAMYLADLIEPDPERTCRIVGAHTAHASTHLRKVGRCSDCGELIETDHRYCFNCGSKVVDE